MVAAVAPLSPPTPAGHNNNVQETEKKNVQNYGGLPPAMEKVKPVRKMRNMEITSRYKTATSTTTAAPSPRSRNPSPSQSRNPSPARDPSPLRQPSPSSRQPSPVRTRTSTDNSHVRHPSPNLSRSSSNAPDATKRAFSAERRRPWPAATAADTKPRAPQSRAPELWPSMKPSADEKSIVSDNVSDEGAREKETTSKPAGNGVRRGSPVRRQSIDSSENARPNAENSHSQQRWPGISTAKAFSRSMDLDKEQRQSLARSSTMQTARPGTPSSRTKAAFVAARTATPVAPQRAGTPTRTRAGTPTTTTATTENAAVTSNGNGTRNGTRNGSGNGNGASNGGNCASNGGNCASNGGNGASNGAGDHHVRRLSQDSVATVDSLAALDTEDTESVSSGGSSAPGSRQSTVRGSTVPARVWQDMNNRLRRFSKGGRDASSDLPVIAPVKTVRRTSKVLPMLLNQSMNQSMNGSTTSAWALSPGRVSGHSAPSTPHPPSSPSHAKGASPLRGLPSPQRSRPSAALTGTARIVGGTTLSFGIGGRGRKALTQQEEAQLLRILHNRWLQWRFVNARAEAVTSAQKAAAERQLYNVWVKTSELRTSVAMQRIKLQRARQAHKLRSILSTHATHLEDWETLEEEHSNALTGCMEALESAILRVPVTGGARADVQAVKEALNSAVDVLNAVEGSVHFLLPKTQSMEALLSQLAETAAQERALLEECGDLLSVAASLEVEERSLRTHLIQLENERVRLFKAEPVNEKVANGDCSNSIAPAEAQADAIQSNIHVKYADIQARAFPGPVFYSNLLNFCHLGIPTSSL